MTKTTLLLLVEDEPIILMNAEDALANGGYTVVTALNGQEAMARLEERSDAFAGLITDVRLCRSMDGWEVARKAREINSRMAVVYMTADSATDWAAQGVPESLLLQKPFADAQLVTAISSLLTKVDGTPLG